jgi:hypothetical protein
MKISILSQRGKPRKKDKENSAIVRQRVGAGFLIAMNLVYFEGKYTGEGGRGDSNPRYACTHFSF